MDTKGGFLGERNAWEERGFGQLKGGSDVVDTSWGLNKKREYVLSLVGTQRTAQ